MTSKRQFVANRANSQRSTGPRTKAGKSIASSNARLHGLAAVVRNAPGADVEIESIARAIVDEAERPDLIEFARGIAEAEVDLRRIRRARATQAKLPNVNSSSVRMVASPNAKLFMTAVRLENRRKEPSMDDLAERLNSLGWDSTAPDRVEAPLKRDVKNIKLDALERYERRAMSRRKSAIRRFDLMRRDEGRQNAPGMS